MGSELHHNRTHQRDRFLRLQASVINKRSIATAHVTQGKQIVLDGDLRMLAGNIFVAGNAEIGSGSAANHERLVAAFKRNFAFLACIGCLGDANDQAPRPGQNGGRVVDRRARRRFLLAGS